MARFDKWETPKDYSAGLEGFTPAEKKQRMYSRMTQDAREQAKLDAAKENLNAKLKAEKEMLGTRIEADRDMQTSMMLQNDGNNNGGLAGLGGIGDAKGMMNNLMAGAIARGKERRAKKNKPSVKDKPSVKNNAPKGVPGADKEKIYKSLLSVTPKTINQGLNVVENPEYTKLLGKYRDSLTEKLNPQQHETQPQISTAANAISQVGGENALLSGRYAVNNKGNYSDKVMRGADGVYRNETVYEEPAVTTGANTLGNNDTNRGFGAFGIEGSSPTVQGQRQVNTNNLTIDQYTRLINDPEFQKRSAMALGR